MKVLDGVIDTIIRGMIQSQFGFMPRRGTTDAIFVVRQLQEKYLAKKKNLYLAFVELERHPTVSRARSSGGRCVSWVLRNG